MTEVVRGTIGKNGRRIDSLAATLLMPREGFLVAYRTAMMHHGFSQHYLVKRKRFAEAREVTAKLLIASLYQNARCRLGSVSKILSVRHGFNMWGAIWHPIIRS